MQIFGKAAQKAARCAALCGTAVLTAPVVAAHAQVFSDDFSTGLATGAATSSDYTLVSAGVATLPNQYRVVNNPATAFTNGFTSYFDHTLGTSAGAMLFFDGSPSGSASRIYYRSGIILTPGTQYTFSFWGSSGSGANVPLLNILIDTFSVGTPSLTTTNGAWTQYSTTYTPTFSGPHTFAIYDVNTSTAAGNDGAIDDVALVGPAAVGPEPSSLALLLPFASGAAGMAGLRLRRRRTA